MRELMGSADGTDVRVDMGMLWWPPIACAIALAGFHFFARWCSSRVDATGRVRWIVRAERMMAATRLGVLGIIAIAVLWQRWDMAVRIAIGDLVLLDELVIAGPILLTIIATWWSIEPLERRVHQASLIRDLDEGRTIMPILSRGRWVWNNTRHHVLLMALPISLLVVCGEIVERVPGWLTLLGDRWQGSLDVAEFVRSWNEPIQWAGSLLVLLASPLLVRKLWDTVPLEMPALRESILSMCRQYRVRISGPWVWRTHGQVANAAILGFFWPFRSMLLTDGLLQVLSPEQVGFVVAHEVAHVRERHMLWLAIAMLGATLSTGAVLDWIAQAASAGGSEQTVGAALLASAIASLLIGLLVFGWVSRRFEWQADAFAISHGARASQAADQQPSRVGSAHGALAVSTLDAIASFNGMSVRAFMFRHGSIAERQRRARASVGETPGQLPIDGQARRIKIASLVLLGLGLLPLFLGR